MFRTVRVLAENGPVRVELALEDDLGSGNLVVIKRLLGFHPTLERRLSREAEVVAKLDHPNILPLLREQEGSIHYPYLPGPTLAEVLERGPLPVGRVRRILHEILAALAYAHERGIIHNDVKPGNLMVRAERVILLDFGFAKDLGLAAITGQGAAMGTPNYMAPEQFEGLRSDPRSDLYGAAAVAYHALTGEPPYGRDVLRVLVGDDSVQLTPPPDPSGRLAAWFEQALARDPAARFQDAHGMRAALDEAFTTRVREVRA